MALSGTVPPFFDPEIPIEISMGNPGNIYGTDGNINGKMMGLMGNPWRSRNDCGAGTSCFGAV